MPSDENLAGFRERRKNVDPSKKSRKEPKNIANPNDRVQGEKYADKVKAGGKENHSPLKKPKANRRNPSLGK